MKILLLEDDLATSEFLADALASQRYAVDAIADGSAGLDLASRWPYDLLIVDWLLPSLDGLEVCRRLRAQGNYTPILMLTVRGTSSDVVAGLNAGADDYLAKGCDAAQLLARVRALLRRSHRTPSPQLVWGDLRLDPALTQVTYRGQPVPCRPKEYELLELFLRQPQRLLTRSVIIDHLWPMDDAPVEGSVTNLMKDLRQRLKAAGMASSPIETVYGLGYRLLPPPAIASGADLQSADLRGAALPGGDFPIAALPGAGLASAEPLGSEVSGADVAAADVPLPPPRLTQVLHQATQRFRASLAQRLEVLEDAVAALRAGTLSEPMQQQACHEAHRLAGGLGLFGYDQAAEVAEAIEHLLSTAALPPPYLAAQLAQRLDELTRSLASPLEVCPTEENAARQPSSFS